MNTLRQSGFLSTVSDDVAVQSYLNTVEDGMLILTSFIAMGHTSMLSVMKAWCIMGVMVKIEMNNPNTVNFCKSVNYT